MKKDELRALGERARKCGAWQPVVGMRDRYGYRLTCVHGAIGLLVQEGALDPRLIAESFLRQDFEPDLSDSATLGCVEHGLLPAAWGEDREPILTRTLYGQWVVMVWSLPAPNGQRVREGAAEESANKAEALVAALEEAS